MSSFSDRWAVPATPSEVLSLQATDIRHHTHGRHGAGRQAGMNGRGQGQDCSRRHLALRASQQVGIKRGNVLGERPRLGMRGRLARFHGFGQGQLAGLERGRDRRGEPADELWLAQMPSRLLLSHPLQPRPPGLPLPVPGSRSMSTPVTFILGAPGGQACVSPPHPPLRNEEGAMGS